MTLVRSTPLNKILYGPNTPVRERDLAPIATDITAIQDAVDSLQTGTEAVPLVTTDTTQSTTSGTGSVIGAGGLGISKDAFIAGQTRTRRPIVLASAATLAPAVAASGTVYSLAKADGLTVTLPACATAAIGTTYKFVITVSSTTSVFYIINTTGTDVFIGGVYGTIAVPNATNDAIFATSTANKTMTLNATTTGGLIGGWIELTMVSATQWHVSGMTLGTGTQATPFSN